MPCDYAIDVEQQLIRARLRGAITGTELRELRARISDDPRFSPDQGILLDLCDASTERLTTSDIRDLASKSRFGEGARRAIVTAQLAAYGLARMFQVFRETSGGLEQTQLFESVPEAEAWLAQRAPRERDINGTSGHQGHRGRVRNGFAGTTPDGAVFGGVTITRRCPVCLEGVGLADHVAPAPDGRRDFVVVTIVCQACGHQWNTEQPSKSDVQRRKNPKVK